MNNDIPLATQVSLALEINLFPTIVMYKYGDAEGKRFYRAKPLEDLIDKYINGKREKREHVISALKAIVKNLEVNDESSPGR